MTAPQQLDRQNDLNHWKELIISTLYNHRMTANELVNHLLAEHYGNIDEDSVFIISMLNALIGAGIVKVSTVRANPDKNNQIDTYLTSY